MNSGSQILELLNQVIVHPNGGVVRLVDDLLVLCRDEGLRIDWQNNRCQVRSGHSVELFNLDVPTSVFRAILARIAALCNARKPGSVSPYGGKAELSLDSDPGTVFAVAFVNTASEQRLEVDLRPPGLQGCQSNTTLENPVAP